MAYGVISQWTSSVARDAAMEATAREKYVPGIKALGALNAFFIATGDTTFNVVTIYPDEATATAAADKQRHCARKQPPICRSRWSARCVGMFLHRFRAASSWWN